MPGTEIGPDKTPPPRLGRSAFAAMLLILAQASIGMVVNLYVATRARHPGAHPSGFGGP